MSQYAIVFILIGCIVGYYLGYRDSSTKTNIDDQLVKGMMAEDESSDAEKALRAIKVIEAIDSGQNQKAVQLLVGPIEFYYRVYKPNTGIGGQRIPGDNCIRRIRNSEF